MKSGMLRLAKGSHSDHDGLAKFAHPQCVELDDIGTAGAGIQSREVQGSESDPFLVPAGGSGGKGRRQGSISRSWRCPRSCNTSAY